jgi:probable rRNA maturation factor
MPPLVVEMADGASSAGSQINVIVSDAQDFLTLDSGRWEALVVAALSDEGAEVPLEVGLDFVGVDAIADLHERHLGGQGPTDVLSFPLDDDSAAVPSGQVRLLGDIVVCPEIAATQATAAGHGIELELAVLVVHGVLHLLGYDHADPEEKAAMFGRQAELVESYGAP